MGRLAIPKRVADELDLTRDHLAKEVVGPSRGQVGTRPQGTARPNADDRVEVAHYRKERVESANRNIRVLEIAPIPTRSRTHGLGPAAASASAKLSFPS